MVSNDRLHLDESDQGNTQVKSDDHKLTYQMRYINSMLNITQAQDMQY